MAAEGGTRHLQVDVYKRQILGMGMGAAAGIPSNLVQAVTGIVIALVLVALLKGSKALDKIAVQW